MDRRNFFSAALATVAAWFWAPKLEAKATRAVADEFTSGWWSLVANDADSGRVLYLSTGDVLRPGEWFAVPYRPFTVGVIEYPA